MSVRFAVAAVVLVLAGCGAPATVEKQADAVGSLASEGALLAHDASEGDTTETFTRVHAGELSKNVGELAPQIDDRRLARVARSVGADLERLADDPGDEPGAARLERRLEDASKQAEEIGKAGS